MREPTERLQMAPLKEIHSAAMLRQQTEEAARLDTAIRANWEEIGYGG